MAAKTKELSPEQQLRFDTFWAAFPRKQGKGAARKAWSKINASEDLVNRMLSAIAHQLTTEQWLKNQGEFIPFPATWLNQERWEDEGVKIYQNRTEAFSGPKKAFLLDGKYKTHEEWAASYNVSLDTLKGMINANPEKYRSWIFGAGQKMPRHLLDELMECYEKKINLSTDDCPY